jgi:hypothetical protein
MLDRQNSDRSTEVVSMQEKKRIQVSFAKTSGNSTLNFEGSKKSAIHEIDDSLWWSKDESKEIHDSWLGVVNAVKKKDTIWTQARKYSYVETLSRIWMSCFKGVEVSIFMKQELFFWTAIGHSRRGLEKFTLSRVQAIRCELRKQHIQEILALQEKCKEFNLSYEQSSHYMRLSCEENSRAALRFGRLLAEADWYAAHYDGLDFLP